jgi:adenylosuccinate synthase
MNKIENIAVLGAEWGDGGKGNLSHHFSPNYDWIVRYAGGNNAGHTIWRDGKKYVHNILPSFDWRSPKPKAFIGSGTVINPIQLLSEVQALAAIDPSFPSRVYVDPDAFLVLPEHIEIDKQKNAHLGSTNRGIGPAYVDKVARTGTRLGDLFHNAKSQYPTLDQAIADLHSLGCHFTYSMELQNNHSNDSYLFEGAQGLMLDINHGCYPYVSNGDATTAGILSSGFGFVKLNKVYGITKCYSTKVGTGPFPTELTGQEAETLRELGGEHGATTGRPRRIGWLDLPALKYACKKALITDLIITKLDILQGRSYIPVCQSYATEPICPADFNNATPQYQNITGWKNARNYEEIKPFMENIEQIVGVKVSYYSCGVGEQDILPYSVWRKGVE